MRKKLKNNEVSSGNNLVTEVKNSSRSLILYILRKMMVPEWNPEEHHF